MPVSDTCGIIASYLDSEDIPKCSIRRDLSEKVHALLVIDRMCEVFDAVKSDVQLDVQVYQREEGRAPTDPVAAKIAEFAIAAGKGNKRRIRELLEDKDIQIFDLRNKALPWQQPRYIAFSTAIEQAFLHSNPEMIDFLTSQHAYRDMVYTKIVASIQPNWERRNPHHLRTIGIRQRNHVAAYKKAVREEMNVKIAQGYVRTANLPALKKLFIDDYNRSDYDRSNSTLQKSIFKFAEISPSEEVSSFLIRQIDTSDPIYIGQGYICR